jgi:diacylglycerol kinase (ATP)
VEAGRRVTELPRPDKATTGPVRLSRAFGSSFRGFGAAWREEEAFRQECLLALVVVPLGLWLGESGVERALLAGPMLLILVIELLNSAVEATVDRIGVERHPLSGIAKELGSAAVFVAFLLLFLNWLLVLVWRH